MESVLSGIRVIEWGVFYAAPAASKTLGDLGAEVIKIEHKEQGDPGRGEKRWYGIDAMLPGGRQVSFETHNRHKKSIALDISKEDGKQVVYRLVQKSDVFITNYRPSVVQKQRMDYETLRVHNPRLIYACLTGYGTKGPYADSVGYDYAGQAMSGIMMFQREPDEIPFSPGAIGDQMGAIAASSGILAALLARERFGVGQKVEVSLLGSLMWLQTLGLTYKCLTGKEPEPGTKRRVNNPLLNVYPTADGKWLCLAMGAMSDKYWPHLCRALGMPQFEQDSRFRNTESRQKNKEQLVSILDGIFSQRRRDEWLDLLKDVHVAVAPVNSLSEVIDHPQVVENEYVIGYNHPVIGETRFLGPPIHLSKTPMQVRGVAPEHGQHTEEVLLETGDYTWEQIGALKEAGVIP